MELTAFVVWKETLTGYLLKSLYTLQSEMLIEDVVYLSSVHLLNRKSLIDSTHVDGCYWPHCTTLSWGNPCCTHLCCFRIPFIQGCCSFTPVLLPFILDVLRSPCPPWCDRCWSPAHTLPCWNCCSQTPSLLDSLQVVPLFSHQSRAIVDPSPVGEDAVLPKRVLTRDAAYVGRCCNTCVPLEFAKSLVPWTSVVHNLMTLMAMLKCHK